MPAWAASGTLMLGYLLLMISTAVCTAAWQRWPASATGPVRGKIVPILMTFSWARAGPDASPTSRQAVRTSRSHRRGQVLRNAMRNLLCCGLTLGRLPGGQSPRRAARIDQGRFFTRSFEAGQVFYNGFTIGSRHGRTPLRRRPAAGRPRGSGGATRRHSWTTSGNFLRNARATRSAHQRGSLKWSQLITRSNSEAGASLRP